MPPSGPSCHLPQRRCAPLDIARKVARDQEKSEWRTTITDRNGELVLVGTTRRRPTRQQRRRVEAYALTCVFPGCRISSRDSDIDHRHAWAEGGPTEDANLEPLCRHDHVLKHSGWPLDKLESGGYVWTSPLGIRYVVRPRPP